MAKRKPPEPKLASAAARSDEPEVWTVPGFLDEFKKIHDQMEDRSFLFILGAGASVSSGIPTAKALARDWVEELWRQAVGRLGPSLEEWATPESLGIPDFSLDHVDEFYPQVYDARFRDDPERGQADLEQRMAGAKPGVGYSILARILAGPRHKVVITTNFDNLVADALAAYTDTFPLVCGHESLAGFVRTRLRRPLVAKVHRDLLLAPRNTTEETSELDPRWANALRKLLNEFTPVVVGYGGNDGSLMAFLESLEPGTLQGGVYWCYWAPGGTPKERIRGFVARQRGRLVPISDFDGFMLQLNDRFGWPPLTEAMQAKQQEELERYRTAFEQLSQRIRESGPDGGAVRQALEDTVAREKSWWQWELRAAAQSAPAARDAVYRQGLAQFPRSFELMNDYAAFLTDMGKDHDRAQHFYEEALRLAGEHPIILGNYANLLTKVRKDHDQAERFYKRALELDPNEAAIVGNYALFLTAVRKDHDQAERFYKRALELDPNETTTVGNYALFLTTVRKDHDQAERLYKRALELDPSSASTAGNYANFLTDVRREHNEAERLYKRALELDPSSASTAGNYANFLTNVRKDKDEGEHFYQKSLELDPDSAITAANYAGFLLARHRRDEALRELNRAWQLNGGRQGQVAAETALYWSLLARLLGKDASPGIARAKYLLETGYVRGTWSFEQVLEAARTALPPKELSLFSALAAAILDPEKVPALASFDQWQRLKPIPTAEPWDLAL